MGNHEQRQVETASAALVAELDEAYVNLRRTYVEAASRATSDAEQRVWRERSILMKRHRELVDSESRDEVLDGIAVIHSAHQDARTHIAAQLAVAYVWSH